MPERLLEPWERVVMDNSARKIVITGVTRGLGRALAVGLASAGHTILGCGRDGNELADLRGRLGRVPGYGPIAHRLDRVDVTTDGVEEWAREVVATHGAPELLIGNAGIIHRTAPLWELELRETRAVIETNIGGVLRTLHAFLPAMVGARAGVVALLSSGWGRTVSPGVAAYCASKWGIEGLVRALALELPKGMAAVAVNPGVIDTEMLRSAFGHGATAYPKPETWALEAVPFFLGLNAQDNGRSLTV